MNRQQKSVLVTGASGFVGSHLVEEALKRNMIPLAGIRKTSSKKYLRHPDIRFVLTDLDNYLELEESMKALGASEYAPTYVIHNAGTTKAQDEAGFIKGNAENSGFFFDLIEKYLPSVRKVLFVSSLAAKGPADFTDRPLSMEDEDLPGTPYGRSKLMGEKRLKQRKEYQHIILRPTAIYGPRETKILQLPKIMKRGLEPDFAPIGQKVSFIHVYDFCRLAFDTLESEHADKTYLVTDGHAYEMSYYRTIIRNHLNINPVRLRISPKILLASVRWINRLAKTTGQVIHTTPEKIRDVTALNWTVDLSPLEEDYNFSAQYPLEKGLPETLDWYRKKGWL